MRADQRRLCDPARPRLGSERTRLLLWSAVCFAFLAVENVLLLLDLSVWTGIDLRAVRTGAALAGLTALLYGFIFDTDRGRRP